MLIDETDRRILRHALAEPGASRADLAERAGVTPATLWRRMERLRDQGAIKGLRAVIDWRRMGYEVEVSLRFTLDKTNHTQTFRFITSSDEIERMLKASK